MMLTFILFVIVGFYLLGLLGRIFLRIWIKRQQQKFGQTGGPFYKTYSWGAGKSQQKPEGEIYVEQTSSQEKKINTDVGDYVDYEEVKEDKTE